MKGLLSSSLEPVWVCIHVLAGILQLLMSWCPGQHLTPAEPSSELSPPLPEAPLLWLPPNEHPLRLIQIVLHKSRTTSFGEKKDGFVPSEM